MKRILFLCTGNYYRSRFAEEYFNHHAYLLGLSWLAESKGIQRNFSGNGNVGPISKFTLEKLESLTVKVKGEARFPEHVQTNDFSEYDRVIAVSIDEHQPMLNEHWPISVTESVEFFDVEDLHIEGADTALARLIKRLDHLISTL